MTVAQILLGAALGVPLVLLAACTWTPARKRMLPLLAVAPVPALLAALLFEQDAVLTIGPARGFYRATLALDAPGALLLGVAALLWIAAGAMRHVPARRGQCRALRSGWLLALTGCLGRVHRRRHGELLPAARRAHRSAHAALVSTTRRRGRLARRVGLSRPRAAGETLVLVASCMLAAGSRATAC